VANGRHEIVLVALLAELGDRRPVPRDLVAGRARDFTDDADDARLVDRGADEVDVRHGRRLRGRR
jgi:hypothetical protein